MPDQITATATESKFTPHPEGQFAAQCVDVVDLGEYLHDFPGSEPYVGRKCALVFRSGELNPVSGDPIDIAAEFTVSMGERANLRKFLEQWRGKAYSVEEARAVPLHKLAGNWGLLTVAHKVSGKGRTYATVVAIVGVPKQMQAALPALPAYTRDAEWWDSKKAANAEAVRGFRTAPPAPRHLTDEPPAYDGDEADGLPF
jgi:hypothetical protein